MSNTIKLSRQQSRVYASQGPDGGELRRTLADQAQLIANATAGTVELYSSDGITLEQYLPDPWSDRYAGDGYTGLRDRIEALRDDADQHGDMEQVNACDRALAGSLSDIEQCISVFDYAAMRQAED